MKRRHGSAAWVLAVGTLLALAGCGSEPSGPGVIAGIAGATAPATLGAVVLEVTGSGITGFEAKGGTTVYGARVSAENGRYRVVVVGTGDLGFGVELDDVKGPKPVIEVVSAVDADNAVLPVTSVQVSLPK